MKTFSPELSPLDGRYAELTQPLLEFFSEEALFQKRVLVEINWIRFLVQRRVFTNLDISNLAALDNLTHEHFLEFKEIEKVVKHDIKATELFIKKYFPSEIVHIFLTSEDVNNIAYALLIRGAVQKVILPVQTKIRDSLGDQADYQQKMLSRTHGQYATPTTLGHMFDVYYSRLQRISDKIADQEILAKFNGTVGTYSLHKFSKPQYYWEKLCESFVNSTGLRWNASTTQIEPHDWIVELVDSITHFNNVCHGLAVDMWLYISYGYFVQKQSAGSVGSSVMPHKMNPINFENAEGNFELANGMLRVLSDRLPESRMQRDLSDSTLMRNIGSALGYTLVAYVNLWRGMQSIEANREKMNSDLDAHFEVLTEAVQTQLRLMNIERGIPVGGAYETVKQLTQNRQLSRNDYFRLINSLPLSEDAKAKLGRLTPNYY